MFEQCAGSRLRWKESGRDTACTGRRAVAVSEESSDSETKNDSNTDADDGAENSEVAAADETAEHQSVGTEGMTPMDGSELRMACTRFRWTPAPACLKSRNVN